jgi:hypothetical protein
MNRFQVFVGLPIAFAASIAVGGEMVVHDAVVVTDGSTRLVNCQNTRGLFVLSRPLRSADAFVVDSDIRDSRLSDALARLLPPGWNIRYSSANVENERVNLQVRTYWADALRVLSNDFNLFTLVDGERQEVIVGRL